MRTITHRFGTIKEAASVYRTVAVDLVGPFELRLLASINRNRSEAWGSKLQRDLSTTLGRDVAIGQLYLALRKLEQKGFISSAIKDPEPRQGGRAKKVFHLEAPGIRALENTAAIVSGASVAELVPNAQTPAPAPAQAA